MSAPLTLRQATVLLMTDCGAVRRVPGLSDSWELRGNAKPGEGQQVTRVVHQLRYRKFVVTNFGSRAVLTAAGRAAMERRFGR